MNTMYWIAWGVISVANIAIFVGSLHFLRSTRRLLDEWQDQWQDQPS